MKALNVEIRDVPNVGLVAVLPPNMQRRFNGGNPAMFDVGWSVEVDDVLGVVTKCEHPADRLTMRQEGNYGAGSQRCKVCGQHRDDWSGWQGTGYAPLKFVKVLAVWQVVGDGFVADTSPYVEAVDGGETVLRSVDDDGVLTVLAYFGDGFPDAEPGGVALHVEPTDCLTCEGIGGINHDEVGRGDWCPTCQTPFVPPSDAPIVEVK